MNTQQQAPQMATPINNLPLKTAPPQDQSEIEDPLIQNVLKEFEDDMRQSRDTLPSEVQQPVYIHPQPQLPQQPLHQPPQQYYQQPSSYRKQKKLIDMNILKKVVIIAIIVFLFQNYNVISILMEKLPESVTNHLNGKEFILNFILIVGVFYALMYFELI